MRRLFCFIGLHAWRYKGRRDAARACDRCGKFQQLGLGRWWITIEHPSRRRR